MATLHALSRGKQVGQDNDVVFRVASVGPLIIYRGGKGPMAALSEVLPGDGMFVGGNQSEKGGTDEFQLK